MSVTVCSVMLQPLQFAAVSRGRNCTSLGQWSRTHMGIDVPRVASRMQNSVVMTMLWESNPLQSMIY